MIAERVHIYMLPDRLNNGYCFGKGHPIPFLNVDWFDVVPSHRTEVAEFVRRKSYFIKGRRYLMLGETFAEIIE